MYKNKKKSNISKRIIIVGNPNCGKSTIFNSLTGFQQKVGNWSGVTVDEKVGTYLKDDKIEIIDLPGLYSLTTTEFDSLDEQNASCIILKQDFDLIIHVIDVSHINTTLYLTIHLLEMGLPMIIVLNMVHLIEESELKLIQEKLALRFKCPIIGINAKIKSDVEKLDIYITSQPIHPEFNLLEIHKNTPVVLECISEMRAYFQSTDNPEWHAIYNMEVTEPNFLILDVLQKYQKKSEALYNEGIDVILLNNRCQYIENVNSEINIKRPWQKLNDTLDVIFLNKFLSFPILLMFMYLAFSFSILIGGAFQEFFELTTQAILIDGLADCLKTLSAPLWVIELFAYGIGGGIQTVATFIPVIAGLYIFLSFLEESGYMTRAAIVADRLMQVIGLPGKAFVPLIIGFGCNVPAIMAARTLDNKTERLATILITPFMSCSARFSVFSLFAAAFFPSNGHNIIFLLYILII